MLFLFIFIFIIHNNNGDFMDGYYLNYNSEDVYDENGYFVVQTYDVPNNLGYSVFNFSGFLLIIIGLFFILSRKYFYL